MTDDSRPGDRNRPRRDQSGRSSGRGQQGGRPRREDGASGGAGARRSGGQPAGPGAKRTGGDRGGRPDRKPSQSGSSADAPPLPPDVTPDQLDPEVRAELSTLPHHLADHIARHVVMVGNLVAEDPELAYRHARYARTKASRVGAVREVAGVAAYSAGKWQEALSELRAARRMTGRSAYIAIMADCERGLGRPERALELAHSPEVADLDVDERVEVKIVAAGARRDLGESEAALVELRCPELNERRARPWAARLFYSYADALLELGRERDAREYFARASAVDREGVTDADDRLAELEGLQIVDMDDDVVWTDAEEADIPEPTAPEAGERPGNGARGEAHKRATDDEPSHEPTVAVPAVRDESAAADTADPRAGEPPADPFLPGDEPQ